MSASSARHNVCQHILQTSEAPRKRTLRDQQRLIIRRASAPDVFPIVVPAESRMIPPIGGVLRCRDDVVMRHPARAHGYQ